MTTKFKFITVSILSFILVLIGIYTYWYIDCLSNQIENLNAVISDKDKQIVLLQQNIETLNKHVEANNNVVYITNDYIEEITEIKSEEDIIKTAIYEEVLNDETDEIKNWLNERLPDSVATIINDSNKRMCENSI